LYLLIPPKYTIEGKGVFGPGLKSSWSTPGGMRAILRGSAPRRIRSSLDDLDSVTKASSP